MNSLKSRGEDLGVVAKLTNIVFSSSILCRLRSAN